MEDDLTKEEMQSIIKAIVAYNQGTVQFDTAYLNYAKEIKLTVDRAEHGTLTLTTTMPSMS